MAAEDSVDVVVLVATLTQCITQFLQVGDCVDVVCSLCLAEAAVQSATDAVKTRSARQLAPVVDVVGNALQGTGLRLRLARIHAGW